MNTSDESRSTRRGLRPAAVLIAFTTVAWLVGGLLVGSAQAKETGNLIAKHAMGTMGAAKGGGGHGGGPGGGGGGGGKPTKSNGIDYHGGPVMLQTTNVYYIWYGTWTDAAERNVLTNLAQNIGGSPYYNIQTSYYDGAGNHIVNAVNYAGATDDNYSQGTQLSDSSVATIVSSAINGGKLPKDTSGVYFVLTSADVAETSGFGSQYCGWHTYQTLGGSPIKFSFVGDPSLYMNGCAAQTSSPSGYPAADAMASVVAHELVEAVSDPQLNAWYDKRGYENADKCAWTFGNTYTASNGTSANMTLGGEDYLIQQNWVNASGGYCALSY